MNEINSERWSAPGSLLIAGEYLITEEGGRGLAIAGGGRAYLDSVISNSQKTSLIMEGRWPGGGERWCPEDSKSGGLASEVWNKCLRKKTGLKILVDTEELHNKLGRKLGFGSSAAAALLYTRGLMPSPDTPEMTDCALKAHRSWQNDRGSGYDILTSIHGGAGVFTGGKKPGWEAVHWPEVFNSWIIQGPDTVSSPDAVSRFHHWKESAENKSSTLLQRISGEIRALINILQSEEHIDSDRFLENLNQLSLFGTHLGEEIGVPAVPVFPDGYTLPVYRQNALAAKCLGAGNETILLLALPDGLSRNEESSIIDLQQQGKAIPLNIERQGLRREKPPRGF